MADLTVLSQAVYNQRKHCPGTQPWSTQPGSKQDSQQESQNCCRQGCFSGKTAKREQGRGWQRCTGSAPVFPKSRRAMQGKNQLGYFFFPLSQRWRCESPCRLHCNHLISAGQASDFATDRTRLISSDNDKPVDLLEGCKNNSDKSIVTQENCVPSSNHGSANMQLQH